MCDEWCCIGTAALSPPLIVTSPETKGRRSRGGEKNPAARAVDASFYQHTHAHTQCLYASTYTAAPLYQCKHMTTDIKAHTHMHTRSHPDNLYLTAVCIC